MIQKEIRAFNDQTFTPQEAANWLQELVDRTKSSQAGYNSIDELGTVVKAAEALIEQLRLGEIGKVADNATEIQSLAAALSSIQTLEAKNVFTDRADATNFYNNEQTPPTDGVSIYLMAEKEFHKWDASEATHKTTFVRSLQEILNTWDATNTQDAGSMAETEKRIDEKIQETITSNIAQSNIGFITLSGGVGNTVSYSVNANTGWNHTISDALEGDTFLIKGQGGQSPRLWGFVDASDNLISVADIDINTITNPIKLTAPTGTAKIIVNHSVNGNPALEVIKYSTSDAQFSQELEQKVNTTDYENAVGVNVENWKTKLGVGENTSDVTSQEFNDLKSEIYTGGDVGNSITFTNGQEVVNVDINSPLVEVGAYSITGAKTDTSLQDYRLKDPLRVAPNKRFRYEGETYTSDNIALVIRDSNGDVVDYINGNQPADNGTSKIFDIVMPSNAYDILLCWIRSSVVLNMKLIYDDTDVTITDSTEKEYKIVKSIKNGEDILVPSYSGEIDFTALLSNQGNSTPTTTGNLYKRQIKRNYAVTPWNPQEILNADEERHNVLFDNTMFDIEDFTQVENTLLGTGATFTIPTSGTRHDVFTQTWEYQNYLSFVVHKATQFHANDEMQVNIGSGAFNEFNLSTNTKTGSAGFDIKVVEEFGNETIGYFKRVEIYHATETQKKVWFKMEGDDVEVKLYDFTCIFEPYNVNLLYQTEAEKNNSKWIGHRCITWGDSNLSFGILFAIREQLGMGINYNGAGGRRMGANALNFSDLATSNPITVGQGEAPRDSGYATQTTDGNWLYSWYRQQTIVEEFTKFGDLANMMAFFCCYNDGGGESWLNNSGTHYTWEGDIPENYLLRSSLLTSVFWTNQSVEVQNNEDLYAVGGGVHYLSQIVDVENINENVTISARVKAGNLNCLNILVISETGDSGDYQFTFDVRDKSFNNETQNGNIQLVDSYYVEDADGWYRVYATIDAGASTQIEVRYQLADDTYNTAFSGGNLNGNNTDYLKFKDPQINRGELRQYAPSSGSKLIREDYKDYSEISRKAIDKVKHYYPQITDSQQVQEEKYARYLTLTNTEKKQIFSYKQTFVALIEMVLEYQPKMRQFLTTLLYLPASDDGGVTASTDINTWLSRKPKFDTINENIKEIADYKGIYLIDINKMCGYTIGNAHTRTPDGTHFDANVGYEIGYAFSHKVANMVSEYSYSTGVGSGPLVL
jgi:hypothetical protein